MERDVDTSMRVSGPAAPIRNQVVVMLRSAIVRQRFRPGERLREKELCELVGASRSSVREALRQLETEGLVETVANRGPVVATVSARDAKEIYEVRRVLEGLAARLCAINATDDHRSRLRGVVNEMAAAIASEQLEDLLDLKDQFYIALFDGAGNSLVRKTLGSLHARVIALRLGTMSHPGRPRQTLDEIKRIVDAIEQQDPDQAEAACQAHVLAAADIAVSAPAATDQEHDQETVSTG